MGRMMLTRTAVAAAAVVALWGFGRAIVDVRAQRIADRLPPRSAKLDDELIGRSARVFRMMFPEVDRMELSVEPGARTRASLRTVVCDDPTGARLGSVTWSTRSFQVLQISAPVRTPKRLVAQIGRDTALQSSAAWLRAVELPDSVLASGKITVSPAYGYWRVSGPTTDGRFVIWVDGRTGQPTSMWLVPRPDRGSIEGAGTAA